MAFLLNGLILSYVAYFAYKTVGKKHPEIVNKNNIQIYLLMITIPLSIFGILFFLCAKGIIGGDAFYHSYCGF